MEILLQNSMSGGNAARVPDRPPRNPAPAI